MLFAAEPLSYQNRRRARQRPTSAVPSTMTRNEDRDSGDRRSIEYDEESHTYHVSYGSAGAEASIVVVESVAAITGQSPTQLEPLSEAIDLDVAALDRLVGSMTGHDHGPTARVDFTYAGHEVRVHDEAYIEITPANGGRTA